MPHAWPRPDIQRSRVDDSRLDFPRKGDAFDARLSIHYGLPDTHCLHFGHVPGLPVGERHEVYASGERRNIWNEDLLQIRLVCKYLVYLVVYIHAYEYIGSDIYFFISCIMYLNIFQNIQTSMKQDLERLTFPQLNGTVQQAHPLLPKSQLCSCVLRVVYERIVIFVFLPK